jgi:signal transduction histidine kinase
MRLINKFSLWYLGITFFVLLAGSAIVFKNVQEEVDIEQGRELHSWLDDVAARIEKGHSIDKLNREPVEIKEMAATTPAVPFSVGDTTAFHSQLQRMERQLKAKASYVIHGKPYLISVYDVVVESDDITDAVTKSLIWIAVLFLLFVALLGRLISNRILSPFNKTINAIKSFTVQQKESLKLPETGTTEFNELNNLVREMTNKAMQDYRSLKEFNENASHELQTPLSIAQGKLELLAESNIDDNQAQLISVVHQSIQKLSRLSKSLALLNKIGNQEYTVKELVDLSAMLRESLSSFEEMIEMKSITMESNIDDQVKILLNSSLVSILLNNILSNAIRHNVENGKINVALNSASLMVKNTGPQHEIPTEELFKRFRKGQSSGDSIGLGLSIVKQICDLGNFNVELTYKEPWHTITVSFKR